MADLKTLIKNANEISSLSSQILKYKTALQNCEGKPNLSSYKVKLFHEKASFENRLAFLLNEIEVRLLTEELKE